MSLSDTSPAGLNLSGNHSRYDVIVLGAGAAGLMSAITAAARGRSVLVVERSNKVGKKILMSGGGRCNFTNYFVEPENYVSGNPHFCKSALSRYTQWDFISLVEKYGIEYEERKHGQLFCVHSAADILSMLLQECELAGVDIMTHCETSALIATNKEKDTSRYRLKLIREHNGENLHVQVKAESVVIATGALSIPTLGGSALGYELAEQFGLTLLPRRAGLVPFMFSDALKPICGRLSGIATEVEVSCRKQTFRENILFTHRGISGPAILQISNYWRPGDYVAIDLLPEKNARQWLKTLKREQGKSLLRTVLTQELPRALINELQALWWADNAEKTLADFSDKMLETLGDKFNRWQLKPSASEGYRTAEVTLGGVNTDGINSRTMEANTQRGLYFIGEVLDVTGHLGGFNFQWAWSSGYSAGMVA